MGRLSAAIGRLWQATMDPSEGALQIYMDDVLALINGTDVEKASLIALGIYTLKAFGAQIALGKGERGQMVQWIGIKMTLHWTPYPKEGCVIFSVPQKMIEDIVQAMANWQSKGMIPRKELRSVTGKLSWIGGVTVNVLFAILKSSEADDRDGAEARRASSRQDSRPKHGLVHVKRLHTIILWITHMFMMPDRFMMRREELYRCPG